MKLIKMNITAMKLGDALKEYIKESEKISEGRLPEVAIRLMAASFISGAQWGAGHPKPAEVLKDCELGQELFNQITT